MGIPKKGSRGITVDGKRYRFLIKEVKHPVDGKSKELSVTIQEDTAMAGNIIQYRVDGDGEVAPRDIEHNIRRALKDGWEPSKKGAPVRPAWQWCKV